MSAFLTVWLAALVAASPPDVLRVRASVVVAPCVEAAARAFPPERGRVQVEAAPLRAPGPADVLVSSAVEMTRALEGGAAEIGTEEDVARVPWVLQFSSGAPAAAGSRPDLAGLIVTLPDSPASYEARRWAEAKSGAKARAAGARELRAASVALVPLSLAGPGDKVRVDDVPAIIVRAAVSVRPADPARAAAFVRFLASAPGQTAFAECLPE